jgi:hypothetical protein
VIDLSYYTTEAKLTVAQYTTVGCSPPKNNEILLTRKAGFDKIDILCFGPLVCIPLFSEDTTYAVLFRDMVSIK